MKPILRGTAPLGLALAALLGLHLRGWSQETPPPPVMNAAETDPVEVQTRGPIHEAFAQPLDQKAQPGPVVPKQPPDPVAEIPPDQKPEGDNVQWIPGYWAWDDGRKDFLWVSGTWRVVPPGRKWVPGHWAQVEGGWQWVAGFWAPVGQDSLQYQPPPPDSLDYGPATPAPDDNSMYIPGCWLYQDTHYLWRPGFWTEGQPGWVWEPAHYCYTPAGCTYANGYWDYDLADRGLLFAPVCFNGPAWQTPGWSYTPSYCVDVPNLLASLFVRPDYCHYFFGDYYGPAWAGRGFRPWCDYGLRHYDPLFTYARWNHRGNPGWFRGLRDTFRGRLHGDLPRPPVTLAAQHALFRGQGHRGAGDLRMVSRLDRYQSNHLRLTSVDRGHLQAQRQAAEHFRTVSH